MRTDASEILIGDDFVEVMLDNGEILVFRLDTDAEGQDNPVGVSYSLRMEMIHGLDEDSGDE